MATYTQLITRAAVGAHKLDPQTPMDRFITSAEALFPSVVEELAQSVAADTNHPWRVFISDQTDPIASGGLIPSSGAGGKVIIGNLGFVRDGDDGKICENGLSLTEIQSIITNTNSWDAFPIYAFLIIKP